MKKKYPHNSDIMKAIIEVLSKEILIKPSEFYDKVKENLENKDFNTSLLNEKRLWRVYEYMVYKGMIYDVLFVIKK
ncbi:MAG: hypothetical protein QXW62_02700 [Candidatus Methanomethylicaceae archaeon]|nr:hypothetical protein [Candidatus Verstraetearchaeota archaeon]